MEEYKIIETKMYDKEINGGSVMGDLVKVIGEQKVEHKGKILDLYLYNKVGYTAKNGKPFAALKVNIMIFA